MGLLKKTSVIFNQISVICHEQGHGDENDLKALTSDIKEQGFSYKILKSLH